MRHFILALIATLFLMNAAHAQSLIVPDEHGVRMAIEDYFWGRQNGDQQRLARGLMLEGGDLKSVVSRDGKEILEVMPLSEYTSRNTRPRGLPTKGHILSLDIVDGRMAWVKLHLDAQAPARSYIDYLLLYKIDGAWKIVNKMSSAQPMKN